MERLDADRFYFPVFSFYRRHRHSAGSRQKGRNGRRYNGCLSENFQARGADLSDRTFSARDAVFRAFDPENSRRSAAHRRLLSRRVADFPAYELETAGDYRRGSSFYLLVFDDLDSRPGLRNYLDR